MKNKMDAAVENNGFWTGELAALRTPGLWLKAVWRVLWGRPAAVPLRTIQNLTTAEWMPLAERRMAPEAPPVETALVEPVTVQLDTLSPFFEDTIVEFMPTVPMDLLEGFEFRRMVNG